MKYDELLLRLFSFGSTLALHVFLAVSAGRRQVEFNRHSGEDESSRGRRHHPSPRDRVGPLLAGWGYSGAKIKETPGTKIYFFPNGPLLRCAAAFQVLNSTPTLSSPGIIRTNVTAKVSHCH